MRRLLPLAAALLLTARLAMPPATAAVAQSGTCGAVRADVMTLTDPSAADIDTTQIIGVHVSALAAFPLPDQLPEHSRFDPYETTVYRTAGQLMKAQLAPNQEIDLVIMDPDSDRTITVVFPDVTHCAQGADPTVLGLMQQARQQLVATLGSPAAGGYTQQLTGQAIVTGIGFIDLSVAAQGGSGIELAPVLDIQFDQAAATGSPAAATVAAAAPAASLTASLPSVSVRMFYVDTAPLSATIFCDTDPALQRVSPRTLKTFRSLELALAVYPGYHLNRPC
ncbi:MAG TPA: hypothetical protein VK821_03105 [Dehalococcoidia bacterium]|nr:hypothetical protein [Dehalococcoidia bacterium]